MKRILKRTGIGLGVALLLIQFYRPARTNPLIEESRTIQAHTQMTPEVAAILERSCSDCHSYKTRWPWYSRVAPVSWLVTHDVNEGREHLSLSDWGNYDRKRALHKLEELCEEISKGDMPLPIYTVMHSEARLSEVDKRTLCDWCNGERARIGQSP